jgi:hypothetical protein
MEDGDVEALLEIETHLAYTSPEKNRIMILISNTK